MNEFNYITREDKAKELFFKIPKALMYESKYKDMSANSKLLYGMLLDRTSLSIDNDWFDEKDRAYIICELTEVEIFLGCSRGTASKCLKELKNFNLVKPHRNGQGIANFLYVAYVDTTKETLDTHLKLHKNMIAQLKSKRDFAERERVAKKTKEQQENSKNQKFKNCTSIENTEVEAHEVNENSEKPLKPLETLRSSKIELLEVQKLNPNNTNTNNTEVSMYVCSADQESEKINEKSFLDRYKQFAVPSRYARKVLPCLEMVIEFDFFDKVLVDTFNNPKRKNKESYIIKTLNNNITKGIVTLSDYQESISRFTYEKYEKPKLKKESIFLAIDTNHYMDHCNELNNYTNKVIDEAIRGASIEELFRKSVNNEEFYEILSPQLKQEIIKYAKENKKFMPYWIR